MENENKQSAKERVQQGNNKRIDHLLSEVTAEKLSLTRLSAYATAGLSFAAVLVLVAIESRSVSLQVAVYTFSAAIPLLVFVANLHESFLWYGEKSFGEYKKMAHRPGFHVFLISSYALFAFGFFAMLWHLSVVASLLSFALSFILLSTGNYVAIRLAEIMEGKNEEGA